MSQKYNDVYMKNFLKKYTGGNFESTNSIYDDILYQKFEKRKKSPAKKEFSSEIKSRIYYSDDKTVDKVNILTSKEHFLIGYIADTHIGNRHSDLSDIYKAYNELVKKGGDYMLHGGDMFDGLRKSHYYPQMYDEVANIFVNYYPQSGKQTILIGGDHDRYWFEEEHDVVRDIISRREDVIFAGFNIADINFNGLIVRMIHNSKSLGNYSIRSYLNNISENNKPNIITRAHNHNVAKTYFYNNIYFIQSSSLFRNQKYDKYRKSGIGIWWIEAEKTATGYEVEVYYQSLEESKLYSVTDIYNDEYFDKYEPYEEAMRLSLKNDRHRAS